MLYTNKSYILKRVGQNTKLLKNLIDYGVPCNEVHVQNYTEKNHLKTMAIHLKID